METRSSFFQQPSDPKIFGIRGFPSSDYSEVGFVVLPPFRNSSRSYWVFGEIRFDPVPPSRNALSKSFGLRIECDYPLFRCFSRSGNQMGSFGPVCNRGRNPLFYQVSRGLEESRGTTKSFKSFLGFGFIRCSKRAFSFFISSEGR